MKTYDQDKHIGLDQDVLKTSSEEVWLKRIYLSWSRGLEDVLKTSSEDKDERRLQDVFNTSSSRQMFAGITLNEEMNNIVKIVKSLEESGLLMQGVSKTI